MDLEAAKQELEEFIPHVRNIAECSIRKMAGKDLARFKQFKEQGELSKYCCSEKGQRENSLVLCQVCCIHGVWLTSFQLTYFLFFCFLVSVSLLSNYNPKRVCE